VLQSKFAAGISYGDEESSSESEMKTLYDLLGALPHDDAEGLRSAFAKPSRAPTQTSDLATRMLR